MTNPNTLQTVLRIGCTRAALRILWALPVLLVSLSISAIPAQSQTAPPCASTLVVAAGDTLGAIAARTLGNQRAYERIVQATNAQAAIDASFTRIISPNALAVGWKLCIPGDAGASTQLAPVPTATRAVAPGSVVAPTATSLLTGTDLLSETITISPTQLTIDYLRGLITPGSDLVIEQTLAPGFNYSRAIVSYRSEGLKINALLTVPNGEKPATGWPVIVFNHGYIPPEIYRTTERYIAYVDGFARNGYIVLRPDYRGHAFSEGEARGAYGSPDYTIDVLNAVASMKRFADADPARIGMWGHSMGGYITLRVMVTNDDVKAGVIWAGVVASYPDLLENWNSRRTDIPSRARRWRGELIAQVGTPAENPEYWDSISANSYLADLSGPLQLHHGTADTSVPVEFSETLFSQAQAAGQVVESYTYPGDDHNLAGNFTTAMQRSVAFFDAHLK